MHSYSIDTDERKKVIYSLTVASVAIAYGFIMLLERFNITLPPIISTPSPALVFVILYRLYDNYLWKVVIVNRLRLSKIPVLHGIWDGNYISSYVIEEGDHKGVNATGNVIFEIKQTWSEIQLTSVNTCSINRSKSYSNMVHISLQDQTGVIIKFMYANEVEDGVLHDSILDHKGFSIIRYDNKSLELKGTYYNDSQARKTHGSVQYRKREITEKTRLSNKKNSSVQS